MKNYYFILKTKLLVLILLLFSFSTLSAQNSDSDGDGIIDLLDLDDDNDGIPDAAECTISPANMVSWMNSVNTFPAEVQTGFNTFISGQNNTAGSGLTRSWINPGGYMRLTNIIATSETGY